MKPNRNAAGGRLSFDSILRIPVWQRQHPGREQRLNDRPVRLPLCRSKALPFSSGGQRATGQFLVSGFFRKTSRWFYESGCHSDKPLRVPVFVGHSEAINIEFEDFLDEDEARDILREAPGIMVIDKRDDGGYVTPIECAGDYATFISRLRQDSTIENGLNLWCVSDNLRKDAALNAVQIAETLGQRVLKKG